MSKSKIVRMISDDGSLVIQAVDAGDIAEKARLIHRSSKVCTAALGRLLAAASMMGHALKGQNDSVTVRINGGGPIGSLIAAADAVGNVRGYMTDAHIDIPNKPNGKLDVGGAVGSDGLLSVIRDLGLPEPQIGQVPLVSGEIAEDITSYYAISEQVPTVCALGVLVNPDETVAQAGGFLVQLLPTSDDTVIERVEADIRQTKAVTAYLTDGLSPEEICRAVLPSFDLQVLDEADVDYRCTCSRERVVRALLSTGKDALEEMQQDPVTEVRCHFCPAVYTFTQQEIGRLLEEGEAKSAE